MRFDPVLTAALLRQANSTFAMAVHKPTDVRETVMRLGMNSVAAVAMRCPAAASLRSPLDLLGLDSGASYHRSRYATVAAEGLRARTPTLVP